jgi:hypothetical protein
MKSRDSFFVFCAMRLKRVKLLLFLSGGVKGHFSFRTSTDGRVEKYFIDFLKGGEFFQYF